MISNKLQLSKKTGVKTKKKSSWTIMLGAAFLMATSAIGPGFLTQTTVYTESLMASFAFIILVSIVLDIVAQTNVWRIIAVSESRGQDIANKVFPGLGHCLSFLIVLGGIAFNIGNIAGAGLGLNVLFGIPVAVGAAISALVAMIIFLVKEAGKAMDRFTQIAGIVMVGLMIYVAFKTAPPVGEVLLRTVAPQHVDMISIVTLVGGSVGGYITFAGGHRLLDAGVKGKQALPEVTKSSVLGIIITSIMRVTLFLAALGVVSKGLHLQADNPAASVFKLSAGNIGYKIFGLVMWGAAVTSVVGSAYTSVSFITKVNSTKKYLNNLLIVLFIIVSTIIFIIVGKPVKILVVVGALNGLILPIALGTMLFAVYNKKIVGSYKHPIWLTVTGILVALAMLYMGGYTVVHDIPQLFQS